MASTIAGWGPVFVVIAIDGLFLLVWWLLDKKLHAQPRVYWGAGAGPGMTAGADNSRGRPINIPFRWVVVFAVVLAVILGLIVAPIW